MILDRVAMIALGALLGVAVCSAALPAYVKRYEVATGTAGTYRIDTWTGRTWRYRPQMLVNEALTPEAWNELPQP